MTKMVVLDELVSEELIRQRKRLGIDKYDEVWDGVYVMSPIANNNHQRLVMNLCDALRAVISRKAGDVLAGANVSDRRADWEHNFRCPDVVVVLQAGKAIDCGTHWLGGPDFLIEVQSPGDETNQKLPFYAQLGVRELLIIQRDSRELRLLRHDGTEFVEVEPSDVQRRRLLVSDVVPLAFRRRVSRGVPQTEVVRTDGRNESWVV